MESIITAGQPYSDYITFTWPTELTRHTRIIVGENGELITEPTPTKKKGFLHQLIITHEQNTGKETI